MTEEQAFEVLAPASLLHLIEPMEVERIKQVAALVAHTDRTMAQLIAAVTRKQKVQ